MIPLIDRRGAPSSRSRRRSQDVRVGLERLNLDKVECHGQGSQEHRLQQRVAHRFVLISFSLRAIVRGLRVDPALVARGMEVARAWRGSLRSISTLSMLPRAPCFSKLTQPTIPPPPLRAPPSPPLSREILYLSLRSL